ncbi:EF-hand domain-containing protein [Balamuthia mandrillaris]
MAAVKTIFKIFDVDSLGDFDNFDKIFQCLWTSRSTSLISIFSQNAKLFLGMLNYLHNQAVAETLLSMMKPNLQEQILINFYNTLNANGFFQLLGEKMYGKGAESSYEDASAFFIRLVESCCSFRNADVLFMDIGRNQSLVEGLLHAMTNQCEYPVSHDQQIACMYALRMLLIKSGEKLFDQSLEAYTPVPLPNMLTCVRNDLLNLLKSKAALLGDRLLVEDGIYTGSQLKNKDSAVSKQKESGEFKYSSFVIKKPFGLHRIALLEIIAELVEEVPIETLDGFDPQVWRVLSVWLFEHKFNNVYHALFYRLFKTVVKHNHVPSLKALLSRSKFLTKMISHYTSHTMFESGLRSYILFFSNYLRLMADIQPPSEYLKNFLNSHQPWKEYLPILIKETKRQMITDFPAPSPSGPIHPFLLQDSFGMYGQSAKLNPITEDDVDIDLGSSYADKLGFEGKTAFEEPLKTKKNRKRRTRRKSQQVSTSRENGGDKKVSSSSVPAMNGSKASSSSNSASDDDDSDSFDSDLDSEDEEVNAPERKEAQPKEVTAN